MGLESPNLLKNGGTINFEMSKPPESFLGVCGEAEGQGIGGRKIRTALPNVYDFDRSV
jgi:hypothetical protein